jgi:ribose 5-phosphate isomerase RpiB
VAQPVFDVIIELDASDMHTFKVIPDAARAADAILSGMPYHAHVRSKDPNTGTMYYEFAEDFCDRIRTNCAQESGITVDMDGVGSNDVVTEEPLS